MKIFNNNKYNIIYKHIKLINYSTKRIINLKNDLKKGPNLNDFIKKNSEKNEKIKINKFNNKNNNIKNDKNNQLKSINTKEYYENIINKYKDININENKLILTDKFSRFHNYLRISLTEKCNLRCIYCMPSEGIDLSPMDEILSYDELLRVVDIFHDLGVNKVRLTGGEPLINKNIHEYIKYINNLNNMNTIGITTNGITLNRKMDELLNNGLTHINISLDTLNEKKYFELTRRNGYKKVMNNINLLLDQKKNYNNLNIKINCVIMKNTNDNEIIDFIYWSLDKDLDIRFIEWMPFDSNEWGQDRFLSYNDMKKLIKNEFNSFQPHYLNNIENNLSLDPNDTTKWYSVKNQKGRIGFISSMTKNFCGGCNRLRITADGKLKVCLFGNEDLSLRDAIRLNFTDDEIKLLIYDSVIGKKKTLGGHSDMNDIASSENRPMILIGG